MATIEERITDTGTSYRVKVRLKGHPVQQATFTSKTKAKQWATQTEAAIREGRYFPSSIIKAKTLADAIERYSSDYLPELKDSAGRAMLLGWWLKHYGAYSLPHLTSELLSKARDQLSKTPKQQKSTNAPAKLLSPARVNRYLSALSPVLTACVKEWGWLEFNPMEKVRKKKEPQGIVRFLSKEERNNLLAVLRQPQTPAYLLPVVLLGIFTGARRENILSLTWQQVDFDRRVIQLPETKNGERQALPLVEPAYSELLAWRDKARKDSLLVFAGKINPNAHVSINHTWRTALARAGITNFRFHDLRHSFASELAMSGASLAEIAAGTGHKSLSMVKRYAHLSHDHTASVVERMAAKVALEMNEQNSKGGE
jgi:integrase